MLREPQVLTSPVLDRDLDTIRNVWCPAYNACLKDMLHAEKLNKSKDVTSWRCSTSCAYRTRREYVHVVEENIASRRGVDAYPEDYRAFTVVRPHRAQTASSSLSSLSRAARARGAYTCKMHVSNCK
jgi:hypothetical protein